MISKILNNALQVHSQLAEDVTLHKVVETILNFGHCCQLSWQLHYVG